LSNKSLPWQLFAAATVLFVEALVLFGGAAYFAYGAITGQARLLATLIALIAFTLFAGLWFVSLGVGLIQGKKSSRTASMFAQMVPISIGFGSTSGVGANALLALGLFIPAALVIGLLLSKPVGALMNRTL
jgi:hypothetical protein